MGFRHLEMQVNGMLQSRYPHLVNVVGNIRAQVYKKIDNYTTVIQLSLGCLTLSVEVPQEVFWNRSSRSHPTPRDFDEPLARLIDQLLWAWGMDLPEQATNPELEAYIQARPNIDVRWLVYGDWLQMHGNPRGEIIALEQLIRQKGKKSTRTERVALIKLYAEHVPEYVRWTQQRNQHWSFDSRYHFPVSHFKNGFISEGTVGMLPVCTQETIRFCEDIYIKLNDIALIVDNMCVRKLTITPLLQLDIPSRESSYLEEKALVKVLATLGNLTELIIFPGMWISHTLLDQLPKTLKYIKVSVAHGKIAAQFEHSLERRGIVAELTPDPISGYARSAANAAAQSHDNTIIRRFQNHDFAGRIDLGTYTDAINASQNFVSLDPSIQPRTPIRRENGTPDRDISENRVRWVNESATIEPSVFDAVRFPTEEPKKDESKD